MFKTITHISDLEPTILAKPEIRFLNQSHDTKVACYMISEQNTFDDYFARECRGITFDKNGNIVSRPLHKFFNLGEREETQSHNLDWKSVVRVMDKLDGSNIHGVNIDGRMIMKSKKSFDSDVAVAAEKWLKSDNKDAFQINLLNEWCLLSKLTPTYEWTSPDARIVLSYNESQLRLLHIRENVSGRYFTLQELESICEVYQVKKVDEIHVSNFNIDYFLDLAKTIEGIEGWIIQFASGEMVKLKTQWYCNLHHNVTFLRERDVAQMVLDEKLDDLISILIEQNFNVKRILEIEKEISAKIMLLDNAINDIFIEASKLSSNKEIALTYKNNKFFGLLMQKVSGKDPNIIDYYRKYHLKSDYSLNSVH